MAWTDTATKVLISRISSKWDVLCKSKRNAKIYEDIIDSINKQLDTEYSAEQCRIKWKNLDAKYKKEKDIENQTGSVPSTWPYYGLLNEFLGDRPINTPSTVSSISNDENHENVDEENEDEPDVDSMDDSGIAPGIAPTKRKSKEKKEKARKVNKTEQVLSDVTSSFQTFSKNLIEMEERQLEKDREHEKQMMTLLATMMCQQQGPTAPTYAQAYPGPMHFTPQKPTSYGESMYYSSPAPPELSAYGSSATHVDQPYLNSTYQPRSFIPQETSTPTSMSTDSFDESSSYAASCQYSTPRKNIPNTGSKNRGRPPKQRKTM